MNAIFKTQNLTVIYDKKARAQKKALDDLTLTLTRGEIFGFLGPNGAGKSTTIKMLTGQLRPKKGRITVLGLDVMKRSGEIQDQIGICFERTNLYEQMSAIENLKLFADLYGVKGFDADNLLVAVGLSRRGKDRVSTFSKGMKKAIII